MPEILRETTNSDRVRTVDWFLRGLVAVDFALFVLLFVPAFSGIGRQQPGVADRLWGAYRVAGWRADVVWVCGSTVFILLAAIGPASLRGVSRLTATLCRLWMGCFVVYAGYVVLHMFG